MKEGLNYREDVVRRLKAGIVLDTGTGAGAMTQKLANGSGFVVSIDANKRVFSQL